MACGECQTVQKRTAEDPVQHTKQKHLLVYAGKITKMLGKLFLFSLFDHIHELIIAIIKKIIS